MTKGYSFGWRHAHRLFRQVNHLIGFAHSGKRKAQCLLLAVLSVSAASLGSFAQTNSELPGIVSLWEADGNALDSVSTNHGSWVGTAKYAAGRTGTAFWFDGSGSYVQVTNVPALQLLQESTFMAWINLDQLPSKAQRLMYILGRSQAGNDFDLEVETDDHVRFYPCAGAGSGGFPGSATTVRTGLWYHVAVTYKAATQMQLFMNGAVEVQLPMGCTLAPNSNPFTIGLSPIWQRPFSGRIDQIRAFNRVLATNEIQQIYAAEAGLTGTPLLAIRVSQVELCWQTEVGASYWLEYASRLAPTDWYPLSTDTIQGTGGVFCTNDTVAAGQAGRYYRLVLTNQPSSF